jgi:propanol-preferring alcohol dehydrogenase
MSMQAAVLSKLKHPLELIKAPRPEAAANEILLRVLACGVCRTDLHIIDGELPSPQLPLILGHQIVGEVISLGNAVTEFQIGQKVGVPWLGNSCGHCSYCRNKQENLCDNAQFTGYQLNGGFAEYCVAKSAFCFNIPQEYANPQAAPLLCAGLIGYRAYRKISQAKYIGFYGFGAAAHILIQIAKHNQQEVYAFTRADDLRTQNFALELGAVWAGNSGTLPPQPLDAAIIFAPSGDLIPQALQAVRKGGIVVCAGIHMSDIPAFPYAWLWGERSICSVANMTRKDGVDFLTLAPKIPIQTEITCYPLSEVNTALNDLRQGNLIGAAVIKID